MEYLNEKIDCNFKIKEHELQLTCDDVTCVTGLDIGLDISINGDFCGCLKF